MPPLREGDRYFWGCACERSKLLFLPFFLIFLNLVLEPVASESLVRRNWLVLTGLYQAGSPNLR